MFSWFRGTRGKAVRSSGQASVEGAFLIPVLLISLLLLIQPGIVLYDRMVMHAAAAEGCRLLSTKPAGESMKTYEAAVKRALGAVPEQDCFHVHGGACSWEVDLVGHEGSSQVSVTIKNKLRFLPLFDWGGRALGILDANGCFELEVKSQGGPWPEWVLGSAQGKSPRRWIGEWKG